MKIYGFYGCTLGSVKINFKFKRLYILESRRNCLEEKKLSWNENEQVRQTYFWSLLFCNGGNTASVS